MMSMGYLQVIEDTGLWHENIKNMYTTNMAKNLQTSAKETEQACQSGRKTFPQKNSWKARREICDGPDIQNYFAKN